MSDWHYRVCVKTGTGALIPVGPVVSYYDACEEDRKSGAYDGYLKRETQSLVVGRAKPAKKKGQARAWEAFIPTTPAADGGWQGEAPAAPKTAEEVEYEQKGWTKPRYFVGPPLPNENGVYPMDHPAVEHVLPPTQVFTAKGDLRIALLEIPDGWISTYRYEIPTSSGGSGPLMATTIWPTRTAALRAQLKNLDEIFARLWANEQPGSKRRDLLKKARAWLNDELQKLSEPEAPPPIDLPEPPASAFTVSTEPIEDHEPEYAAA